MKKFILIFSGGEAPKSKEEGDMVMGKWNEWFTQLGDKVLDKGFPFMAGARATDGKMQQDSTSGLNGYSIVQAENYDAAMEMAMSCPATVGGSMVHVFEEMPVM